MIRYVTDMTFGEGDVRCILFMRVDPIIKKLEQTIENIILHLTYINI